MRVPLPPDLPYFRGHFPGRPILPGVAHLALVAAQAGAPLAGVATLRLRRLLGAGDEPDVRLTGRDGARVRFEVLLGPDVASRGTVVLAEPAAAGANRPVRGHEAVADAGEAAALLPHAPPARLVRRVLAHDDAGLAGLAAVPDDSPFAAGGVAPAFLAIEAAAQAAAAFEALRRRAGGGPAEARVGYLVGARDAAFDVPWVPAGEAFEVRVRVEGIAPPLSRYAFETPFARGSISTYL